MANQICLKLTHMQKKFVVDITDNVIDDENVDMKAFFTYEVICFNSRDMDLEQEYGFQLSENTPCVRSIVEYRESHLENGDPIVRKFFVPNGYGPNDKLIATQLKVKSNFQPVKAISHEKTNDGKYFIHSRSSTVDAAWQIEEVFTTNDVVYYRQSASKLPTDGMSEEEIKGLPNKEYYAEFSPSQKKKSETQRAIEEALRYPTADRSNIDNMVDPASPDAAVFMNKADSDSLGDRPRKFAIGGNWKCNGGVEEVKNLVNILNRNTGSDNVDVLVFPPSIFLGYVKENINSNYLVGSQNVAKDCYGAYTGEVCAPMLKDFGIEWTVVGHSERRAGFGTEGESNELVAEKCKVAIDNGVNVVPCVGETLEDREAGNTMKVIIEQLKPIVSALDLEDWDKVILAYEPVWAIGTGKVATPEQAQEVHEEIRKWIAEEVSEDVAKALRIQYGGSVKGESAASLIEKPDIDGFLVGGASLTDDFLTIINAADTFEN